MSKIEVSIWLHSHTNALYFAEFNYYLAMVYKNDCLQIIKYLNFITFFFTNLY